MLFVFSIVFVGTTIAEGFEFTHDPELDKVLGGIFGDFDYSTATMDECKLRYDKISEAISNGTFIGSKHYLANAYVHQGMLGSCLMQDLTDEEAVKEFGPVLESFEKAQKLAPDWDVPYVMLGNFHRSLGNYTNSPTDFREAERFLLKALQIDPNNDAYRQMLQEVQQNFPTKEGGDEKILESNGKGGFEPIPFD